MKQLPYLFVLLLLGCAKWGQYTEAELKAYLGDPDNGVVREKKVGTVKVSAQYRPTDLLVAQELRSTDTTPEEISRLKDRYGPYHYFILNMVSQDDHVLDMSKVGYPAFSDLLQTLAFRMDQYAYLTTSEKDTIPVADFIFPRMYGSMKSTALLFSFSREGMKRRNYEWIELNMKEFGLRTGPMKFRFKRSSLDAIPPLDHFTITN